MAVKISPLLLFIGVLEDVAERESQTGAANGIPEFNVAAPSLSVPRAAFPAKTCGVEVHRQILAPVSSWYPKRKNNGEC